MFDVVRQLTLRTSDGKNIEQKYLMECTWFTTILTGVKTQYLTQLHKLKWTFRTPSMRYSWLRGYLRCVKDTFKR